jgi:hypothetical protein
MTLSVMSSIRRFYRASPWRSICRRRAYRIHNIVIWPFTDPDFTAKGAEQRGGRGA